MSPLVPIWQAIIAAVMAAKSPIIIGCIMGAGYSWWRGHHFLASIEMLVAVAVIFTAATWSGTLGF